MAPVARMTHAVSAPTVLESHTTRAAVTVRLRSLLIQCVRKVEAYLTTTGNSCDVGSGLK